MAKKRGRKVGKKGRRSKAHLIPAKHMGKVARKRSRRKRA
jgi:hypothetical protein